MPDTVRGDAALIALFPNNISGFITAQNLRDFVVTAQSWRDSYVAPTGTLTTTSLTTQTLVATSSSTLNNLTITGGAVGLPVIATFLLAQGSGATVGSNLTSYLIVPRSLLIKKCFAHCTIAPATYDLVFDILLNGTSIWYTTAATGTNKIRIPASTNAGVVSSFDSPLLVEGDLLNISITQIGNPAAGQDICIELYCETRL